MNPPIEDLKDYLLTKLPSELTLGTNLFLSHLPETGDVVSVCLYDVSGGAPDPNDIQSPFVQLLVRGSSGSGGYKEAYTFMETILGHLHRLANTTINSTRYIVSWKTNEILSLGQDKNERPLFTCTLRIQRAVTS